VKEEIVQLQQKLADDEIHIINKLSYIIAFIRPSYPKEMETAVERMHHLTQLFNYFIRFLLGLFSPLGRL